MVYSLAYRRPASSKGSVLSDVPSSYDPSVESGSTGSVSRGIPAALSFNRIIDGATCPVGLAISWANSVSLTQCSAMHRSRIHELFKVHRT